MNAVLRRRLEMAAWVRDFLRAHRTEGVGDGTAVAKFEELVDRAQALAAQQRAGFLTSRSATVQREGLRRALQTKLLRYLSAVGSVAVKENGELAASSEAPGTTRASSPFSRPRAGCWRRRPRRRTYS